jgi:histidine triad (HIT) family protein
VTTYDPQNIFARILRNEIPSDRVYEDDHFIAFHDITPSAPTHLILIPRGQPPPGPAALEDGDASLIGRMILTATKIATQFDLDENGYRLVFNSGPDAGQTVFHIHLHILGGKQLGPVA